RALSARPLFTLDDAHEPARRFAIQLLAGVVADDRGFRAAGVAVRLRARNHLFHTRQILRQRSPARMRLALTLWNARKTLAARFGLYFLARHPGLFLRQQLQLQIAQR